MKISLSLIKQFISIDLSVDKIAELLTLAGIEVENITNKTPSFQHVVVGKIEKVNKHPSSDTLSIAIVNDGEQSYQVVCGAPNCRENLLSAFAKSGATLTDTNKNIIAIKETEIKKEKSYGMLCSAKDLGLYDDATRILELDDSFAIGQNLSILCDPVFDISLTPNLGHCMSALGIARELSALTNQPIKTLSFALQETSSNKIVPISVTVEDKQISSRYCCRIIDNVKIKKSPFWLQKKLEECSIRSVNNVVDVLNYTTLLIGQPMHAFDYKKIHGKKIIVDKISHPETFLCLDGQERKLPKDGIVIKDDKEIIALAGIIGGQNSAIDDNTTTCVIESTCFNPLSISKTSRQLKLSTESSLRFDKGVDSNNILSALNYACYLIQDIIGADVCEIITDTHPANIEKQSILCRKEKVNNILGTKLSISEIEEIFNKLAFSTSLHEKETLKVSVPSYRNDISTEIDLIEEIGRIYGFNNIPKKYPLFTTGTIEHSPFYLFEKRLKKRLVSQGLQEVITCDLISPELYAIMKHEKIFDNNAKIEVRHAKSSEQSLLRPSLLPSFLEIAKTNQDFKNPHNQIFELSRIHFRKNNKIIEQPSLAIMLMGNYQPYHWQEKQRETDFYDLKGLLNALLIECGVNKFIVKKSSHGSFHPGRQSEMCIDEIPVAIFGEIHPSILSSFDIKHRVYFAEINTHTLFERKKNHFTYSPICPFPSSERDWTVTLDHSYPIGQILSYDKPMLSPILETIDLIDIYQSEKLGKNKKNATLRFVYRDQTKTVSFDQVEKEHQKVLEKIQDELKNHILS